MPAPTKPQALSKAKVAQRDLNKAETKATDAATIRDSRVLDAQEAGATYPEIREATGLSIARITQVLRKERHRRHATP